ncbi:hypothetical protein TKK_0007540 [Trichogramma kaykai]
MTSRDTVNCVAKVKKEPFDMGYDEIDDGETLNQAFDTEDLQYQRCLRENSIGTLEKIDGIRQFQPDPKIKIKYECRDVKPNVNLSVPDIRVNEGIQEFQPNHEVKIEFECKDATPTVNSVIPEKRMEE